MKRDQIFKLWNQAKARAATLARYRPDFAAMFRQSEPRLSALDWSGRMKGEKESLVTLADGVEKEFIVIAEQLTSLETELDGIEKRCLSLTELTVDKAQNGAVQFAFQLLKKSEDLLLASYDQFDTVFSTSRDLLLCLDKLPVQEAELRRILLPLNVLTTSFRVEASRHTSEVQETFDTLASSVHLTVNQVRKALELQFDELTISERTIRNLLGQIAASIQKHRQEALAGLERCRGQLHSLNDALHKSGASALDLSQLNQTVKKNIEAIVMALQSQDMTRQRMEHVGKAIDEICAHLDVATEGKAGADAVTRHFVFTTAQIQLKQMRSVFEELDQSGERLRGGMQNLSGETDAAAQTLVKIGGATLEADATSETQTRIAEVLEIITTTVGNIAKVVAVFEDVQRRFLDCSAKATELARDVRYTALNAQVFAIRTPGGATLEVLAGHVRLISDQCIHQTSQMSTAIRTIEQMVNSLREQLSDFQTLSESERESLLSESTESQAKLLALRSSLPGLLDAICKGQSRFAQSVGKVLSGARFPELVEEARERSIGTFEELMEWCGEDEASTDTQDATRAKIAKLKSHYTMASEIDAHDATLFSESAATEITPAFLKPEEAAPPPNDLGPLPEAEPAEKIEALEPVAKDGESFGDNVELF